MNQSLPDAAESITGARPLQIAVREDPQGGADGFEIATASSAGLDHKLNEAKDCDSLFEAAKSAGAVDIGRSFMSLLVEGHTHRDVAIVSMRARILKRAANLDGADISCQSAGGIGAVGLGFDLDEPTPLARTFDPLKGTGMGGRYFRSGNILSLKKSELQPIEVFAQARTGYVEWEIVADVVIDGKAQTITVNNKGRRFD